MKIRHPLRQAPIHLILLGGSVIMVYPLLYTLAVSFLSQADFIRQTWFPFPTSLYLENYRMLLHPQMLSSIASWAGVTLVRIAWYTILPLIVAVLCGYVFARLQFRGREAAFLTLLGSLLVPNIIFQVPLYVMLARWPLAGGNDLLGQGGHGFIDQLPAMLLPGIVNAYNIFLMRQAFFTIPQDYEDAARIDGAGTMQVLWYVYLPMLVPVMMVVVIFTFVSVWNDFVWPLMVVGGNRDVWPIGLAFQKLMSGSVALPGQAAGQAAGQVLTNIPLGLAAGTLVTLPPILCFFFFQRYFLEGLQGVGLKG